MAKVERTSATPRLVRQAIGALSKDLKKVGIPCEASWEKVPGTKLYRLLVIAGKFKNLQFSERQQMVWRIIERTLPPAEQLQISMILTLTPEEAKGT